MAAPPTAPEKVAEILSTYARTGNKSQTAELCGVGRDTVYKVVRRAEMAAQEPSPAYHEVITAPSPIDNPSEFRDLLTRLARLESLVSTTAASPALPPLLVASDHAPDSPTFADPEAVLAALRKNPMTLGEVARAGNVPETTAREWLDRQRQRGVNLHCLSGRWCVEKTPSPGYATERVFEYTSRPDNTFLFGAMGDTHLCSKHERLDVLNRIYDRFAEEGVDRVFHTGNWIEGEAKFNKTEITVHGMDAQLDYLVQNYPRRDGITTYAVSGDDHEGWYGAREGLDIGVHAERAMRDAGRTDWVDLGFMESHVRLVNMNTGKASTLLVAHPGGGSSYADSYVIQKIIESYDGGEKPAVGLYGHFHKMLAGEYRNVWWLQTGCFKDQDIFMRKKRIRSVVGGAYVRLAQDPETGAITEMMPNMMRYFNRGYFNNRWSHSGPVVLPERTNSP